MRRKSMILSMVLLIVCVLGGCQKKEKEKKEFRVLVEQNLQSEAETAKKEWKKEHADIQMKVEVLSEDKEKRSIQIQKIRTEILAGKGPDVFLMNCYQEFTEQNENLFENVNKAMESGTFTDLSPYMKEDAYWKMGQYQMALLTAGKMKGKQYVLPLGCDYPIYLFPQEEDGIDKENLGVWIKNVYESGTEEQKQTVFEGESIIFEKMMQPAVDYEKGEVRFNREKWGEVAETYVINFEKMMSQFQENKEKQKYFFGSAHVMGKNEVENNVFETECIPNTYGMRMAAVTVYGAVGMASEYKKEGYQYLMKFLDGKNLCKGMEESGMYFPLSSVPVQERGFINWTGVYDEERQQKLLQSFREIDGAYFTSQAEIEMYEKIFMLCNQSYKMTEEEIKEEVEKIASEIEAQYQKQVKE